MRVERDGKEACHTQNGRLASVCPRLFQARQLFAEEVGKAALLQRYLLEPTMPPKERRLKPFLINKASLRWLYQPTQVGFVS
ncbi:MAG: hypothetical protein N2045_10360 [Fimbriimonadales bacterium]|jgi:hypothetical protein|nr:hypothetical protein [Fimbriimonadales bacterium]